MSSWRITVAISLLCVLCVHAQRRNVWLVQRVPRDVYSYGFDFSLLDGSVPPRVHTVVTNLVFEETAYDGTLVIGSFQAGTSGPNRGYGPSVRTLSPGTDLTQMLSPGLDPQDPRYRRYVTHLGSHSIPNFELLNEYTDTAPFHVSGLIPELWDTRIERAGLAVDPQLSEFMLRCYRMLRLVSDAQFPGVSGLIYQAYNDFLRANPMLFHQFSYTDNVLRVNRALGPDMTFDSRLMRDLEPHSVLDFGPIDADSPTSPVSQEAERPVAPEPFFAIGRQDSEPLTNGWTIKTTQDVTSMIAADADAVNELQEADFCAEDIGPRARALAVRGAQANSCPTKQDIERLRGIATTSVQVRVGGTLRTITSFGGRLIAAAGTLGAVVLPVFIILDIVEGQWKAAAWAMGATAAGFAADVGISAALGAIGASAAAGPIGLFIGAAVAVLFLILPGLFNPTHEPPTTNVTQIIQYAFFGDATHTGNEQCNQNLLDNGQTPNCSVSYGPGTLSTIFKWDIYDASVFLITMNFGYPMAISDMANNFTVYDYTNPAASANALAIIDCGQSTHRVPTDNPVTEYNAESHEVPSSISEGYACSKPKFKFNRQLAVLPIINETADVAFNLADSGECKIVSDPVEGELLYTPQSQGNYSEPANATLAYIMNLIAAKAGLGGNSSTQAATNVSGPSVHPSIYTNGNTNGTSTNPPYNASQFVGPWSNVPGPPVNFTGKPISIACNLTADIPDVISPTYNSSKVLLHGQANSSTSGDPSYFVAPPAPQPFQPLTVQDSAVCLSSSNAPKNLLCLPNGTFPTCQGAFGFTTSQIDTLSFHTEPSTLTLDMKLVQDSDGTDLTPDTSFDTSITGDMNFAHSMSTATSQKVSFTVTIPNNASPPPAMCIYSAANFKGDVWCMGPGGTNFTSNLVNKAASLTLTSGLSAWLYPQYYGSPLGTQISTNVADLSTIPYRTSSSFKSNVAAAWIYNATAAISHTGNNA